MFTDEQIEELLEFLITLSPETKLYFGCDSLSFRKKEGWHGKFATVLVVHMNGKNGCRVFRNISYERVYDDKKGRPSDRLMKEVYKVTELYNQLIPLVNEFDCEIHLDINPDKLWGSSCVANQAAGYVLGVTGIQEENLKLKPDAWSASYAADGIGRGFDYRKYKEREDV